MNVQNFRYIKNSQKKAPRTDEKKISRNEYNFTFYFINFKQKKFQEIQSKITEFFRFFIV